MNTIFKDYCTNNARILKTLSSGKTIKIVLVPPIMLDLINEKLIQLFKKLEPVWGGRLLAEDLYDSCKKKNIMTWCLLSDDCIIGAATSEIKKYPRLKSFNVFNLVVQDNLLFKFKFELEEFMQTLAKKEGCDILESTAARAGWKHWAKMHGKWEANLFVYTKRIKDDVIV